MEPPPDGARAARLSKHSVDDDARAGAGATLGDMLAADDAEGAPPPAPPMRRSTAFVLGLQGFGLLLSFNVCVNAVPYFRGLYPTAHVAAGLSLAYNLVQTPTMLLVLPALAARLSPKARVVGTLTMQAALLFVLPLLAPVSLPLLMGTFVLCGVSVAVLDSSLFGFASMLPQKEATQVMLAGNGVSGVVASAVNLIIQAAFSDTAASTGRADTVYFGVASATLLACIASFLWLARQPETRAALAAQKAAKAADKEQRHAAAHHGHGHGHEHEHGHGHGHDVDEAITAASGGGKGQPALAVIGDGTAAAAEEQHTTAPSSAEPAQLAITVSLESGAPRLPAASPRSEGGISLPRVAPGAARRAGFFGGGKGGSKPPQLVTSPGGGNRSPLSPFVFDGSSVPGTPSLYDVPSTPLLLNGGGFSSDVDDGALMSDGDAAVTKAGARPGGAGFRPPPAGALVSIDESDEAFAAVVKPGSGAPTTPTKGGALPSDPHEGDDGSSSVTDDPDSWCGRALARARRHWLLELLHASWAGAATVLLSFSGFFAVFPAVLPYRILPDQLLARVGLTTTWYQLSLMLVIQACDTGGRLLAVRFPPPAGVAGKWLVLACVARVAIALPLVLLAAANVHPYNFVGTVAAVTVVFCASGGYLASLGFAAGAASAPAHLRERAGFLLALALQLGILSGSAVSLGIVQLLPAHSTN